jgi:hypothetical protein
VKITIQDESTTNYGIIVHRKDGETAIAGFDFIYSFVGKNLVFTEEK